MRKAMIASAVCFLVFLIALFVNLAMRKPERGSTQIMADMEAAGKNADVQFALNTFSVLINESQRNQIAPGTLPQMKHLLALSDELANTGSMTGEAQRWRVMLLPLMDLMGDAEVHARLIAASNSAKLAEATEAKTELLLSRWWKAYKDPAAKNAILDEALAAAKADPSNTVLGEALMIMASDGAPSADLRERAWSIIENDLSVSPKGFFTDRITPLRKLYALEGKPIEIKAPLLTGGDFSSADWKGKVILVDFWATWCKPCVAELPNVKKAYADYHDKGLEVLGISCDDSGAPLKAFLQADPTMAWPQLFNEKTKGWHPLAKEYGVESIPRMLLIDKKGVLRTVDGRDNLDEMIPKLLAE